MPTQICLRAVRGALVAAWVVVLSVSPVAAYPAAAQASRPFAVDVIAVSSDASLQIEIAGRPDRLRLRGIEIAWCMRSDAVRRLTGLASGQAALLELDEQRRDSSGNAMLGYLWIDGVMLNRLLVSEGYAYASPDPPNSMYEWELDRASVASNKAGRGLWDRCPPG